MVKRDLMVTREFSIETEVSQIDVDKLRRLPILYGDFKDVTFFLKDSNRLNPDNVFTFSEYVSGIPGKVLSVSLKYPGLENHSIVKSGNSIDTYVARAVVSYAMSSNTVLKKGLTFIPFLDEDLKFPRSILNLDESDERVRESLVDYLSGK